MNSERTMISRERVKNSLEHHESDHIPIHDGPWPATIDRWRVEGFPSGVSVSDFFGYDLACFSPDTTPQFPIETLSEDNEYIVERTSFGGIIKNHKDRSTTPMILDYACKSRLDWSLLRLD